MRAPRGHAAAWAATAVAAGLTLSACSVASTPRDDASDGSLSKRTAMQFREQTDLLEARRTAYHSLPPRPQGVVTVDGVEGPLTAAARAAHLARGGGRVDQSTNGDGRAFDRLCAGEIDLVDSSRPIDADEFASCAEVGLDLVQFQVASDAAVLAIRSETDVGGDCLSSDQVKDTFRAGSPVTTWAHAPLGLSDVPLQPGGPDPASSGFGFLGRTVLDSTRVGLADLRSDYRPFATDEAARQFVAGDADDEAVGRETARLERERDVLRTVLERADTHLADAVAARQAARTPRQVTLTRARVAQRTAERNAILMRFTQARATFLDALRAQKRFEATVGNVALFRFPYYEEHADQLRAFEITPPGGELNCVLPTRRTIVDGSYPLSRPLLLTTTVRSLERVEVTQFVDFILAESAELAREVGLVALPSDSIARQRSWITADAPPTLKDPDGQDEDDAVAPAPSAPADTPAL